MPRVVLANLQRKLEDSLDEKDTYWKTRSKSNWLTSGDRNIKYFHHHASQRSSRNFISSLQDELGRVIENID